jgi:antitoxin component YwqK of YwqJK toxin-antitoxin module
MTVEYRSSIPEAAQEQVTVRYPGGQKRRADYFLDGELVGCRWFFKSGDPMMETPLRDGKRHGTDYTWSASGKLRSVESFVDGRSHGVATQWDSEGNLLGSYTMEHGTGIANWWGRDDDRRRYLAAVNYCKDGAPHGAEWELLPDQMVFHERYWLHGQFHGIERMWNSQGRLRRGYPMYYVNGKRINKRQYVRACTHDPSLIPFREEDNKPERTFPPEIAWHLATGVNR